jgi:hypothetical protein
MEELYELSLNEKVNRLRSSLLLFRQNIGRIITRLEENSFKKKEIADIAIHITPFEDTLNEVINYIGRSKKNQFAKNIDQIDIELTLNSVVSSLEKLNELIELLNAFDTTTYRKTITDQINKCIRLSKILFEKVHIIYALPKQTFEELNTVKENIIEELEKNLLVEKKE